MVARYLGAPLDVVRDPGAPLVIPSYGAARLRTTNREVSKDRTAAIHAANRLAAATVRSLRETVPPAVMPPADPLVWRRELNPGGPPSLLQMVSNLWQRGIPVIHAKTLPTPAFQGMAAIVDGRPVVVIGHKHDEPDRVAFWIAHEVGHLARGDCANGEMVFDDAIGETNGDGTGDASTSAQETAADLYATRVLTGADTVPELDDDAPAPKLALYAKMLAQKTQSSPATIILAWGRTSGQHARAAAALKLLGAATGAARTLHDAFGRHVDVEGASQTDAASLRRVFDPSSRHAALR